MLRWCVVWQNEETEEEVGHAFTLDEKLAKGKKSGQAYPWPEGHSPAQQAEEWAAVINGAIAALDGGDDNVENAK